MPLPQTLAVRLGALHAASFTSHGMYLPFSPCGFRARRVADAHRVRGRHSHLRADRGDGAAPEPCRPVVRRTPAAAASHLGQLVGFPLFLLADRHNAIVIGLVALVAVAQPASSPATISSRPIAVQRHPGLNYGRIRGAGSVSFFISNIVGGYLVATFGAGHRDRSPVAHPDLSGSPQRCRRAARGSRAHEPGCRRKARNPRNCHRILWLVLIAGALRRAATARSTPSPASTGAPRLLGCGHRLFLGRRRDRRDLGLHLLGRACRARLGLRPDHGRVGARP